MNDAKPPPDIIVAATCFANASPAIHVAVLLAEGINGKITAMLIEDEAIVRTAALPFTKALYATEMASTPVTAQDMAAAYHRDAKLMEDHLVSATSQTSVAWSFERHSGRLRTLLKQATDRGGLVLVGHSRSQKGGREIVLFDSGKTQNNPVIQLGLDIATRTKSVLRVFTSSTGQDIIAALDVRMSSKPGLSERMIIQNDSDTADRFLAHIAETRPFVILIGRQEAMKLDAEKLADIARCPVIIDNRELGAIAPS